MDNNKWKNMQFLARQQDKEIFWKESKVSGNTFCLRPRHFDAEGLRVVRMMPDDSEFTMTEQEVMELLK